MIEINLYLLVILVICILLWLTFTKEDENVLIKRYLWKFKVYASSVAFMFLSKDNKGVGPKKNPDPDTIVGKETGSKTIVFLRHGESDWNHIFNKGININLLVKLVKAVFQEMTILSSNHSYFLDSPLNFEGIDQALELRRYIEKCYETLNPGDPTFPVLSALAGKSPESAASSILVTSSLRRAVATTTLALWPRLERTGEKIHVLSSLQEISRNVDTFALSEAGTIADLPFSRLEPHCGGKNFSAEKVYDCSQNFGNKRYNFYGIKRMRSFAAWAMKRPENIIVVGGHSLWFKYFFQTFLPHKSDHEAKRMKITNSGIVSFTLHESVGDDGEPLYRIDPASMKNIYGGFTSK